MTFPKIELLCPQCGEPMDMIKAPNEVEKCDIEGYDLKVEYHFQCKSNERHAGKWHRYGDGKITNSDDGESYLVGDDEWCDISADKEIAILRILIPELGVDNGGYVEYKIESLKRKEPMLESILEGKLYQPKKWGSLYLCPVCNMIMNCLNPTHVDPDYYHFKCDNCGRDYRLENPADKDFKF